MPTVSNSRATWAELESAAERQLGAGFPWLAAGTLLDAVEAAGVAHDGAAVKRLWRQAHYALALTPSRRRQGEQLVLDTLRVLDAYPPDSETEAAIGRELLRIEQGTTRLRLTAAPALTVV
jgi:hypothetical protein